MEKIFLDDIRPAPTGFELYRPDRIDQFLEHAINADVISMDHDLGDNYPTGYQILCKLEQRAYNGEIWSMGAPEILIHSSNPAGVQNLNAAIQAIYRKVGKRQVN